MSSIGKSRVIAVKNLLRNLVMNEKGEEQLLKAKEFE